MDEHNCITVARDVKFLTEEGTVTIIDDENSSSSDDEIDGENNKKIHRDNNQVVQTQQKPAKIRNRRQTSLQDIDEEKILDTRLRDRTENASMAMSMLAMSEEPKSYQEAINSSESDKWLKAMENEYKSLLDNQTWVFIELFGLKVCDSDPCVFVSHQNNTTLFLAIYVDDGIVAGSDEASVQLVIKHLQEKFDIKAMNIGCFLGFEIDRQNDGSIFMHQTAYANKVLHKFQMQNCVPVSIPSDPNQMLCKFEDSSQ